MFLHHKHTTRDDTCRSITRLRKCSVDVHVVHFLPVCQNTTLAIRRHFDSESSGSSTGYDGSAAGHVSWFVEWTWSAVQRASTVNPTQYSVIADVGAAGRTAYAVGGPLSGQT